LFVSSNASSSLLALDISQRDSPRVLGVLRDPRLAGARGNSLAGDFLYVSSRKANAVVKVDVADPSQMRIVKHLVHESLEGAYGNAYSDHRVYAAGAGSGCLVVLSE